MSSKDWEFLEHVSDELPTAQSYEDQMMRIEGEVYTELHEEVDEGWVSAEECEALYAGWIKKYRGVHHDRPALILPAPPEAIGV